ncbi:hypothetical protein LMF32_12335 [Desemzia sp. C1]|uniref:hypothetical protein n=1 Tax=Desemzia sp. C1 TaxID=2892016 RepID=UPI001E5AF29C|nr:hypothetical protein [Desemzia sp. C1]MCI3029832.1 hypothetical protein [Desemzia sp. C1]
MNSRILLTEASVVKIIDEYKLVINTGSNHDVKKGDIAEIFAIGEEVTDPSTGDSLGTMDIIKDELLVTIVYPNMSICEKEKKITQVGATMTSISQAFAGQTISNPQKIRINPEDISGGFEEQDLTIRIGDPVRIYSIND